jgi:hypothetical protein
VKNTTGDPIGNNNFFRVGLYEGDCAFIQRKVNGVQDPWILWPNPPQCGYSEASWWIIKDGSRTEVWFAPVSGTFGTGAQLGELTVLAPDYTLVWADDTYNLGGWSSAYLYLFQSQYTTTTFTTSSLYVQAIPALPDRGGPPDPSP